MNRLYITTFLILLFSSSVSNILIAQTNTPIRWTTLEPGMEYSAVEVKRVNSSTLHVVRIDTQKLKLKAVIASEIDKKARTVKDWSSKYNLLVATNLGMYQEDLSKNVGYLRNFKHINNGHWAEKYKSALAFNPNASGIPITALVDIETPESKSALSAYDTVMQNLRLIKSPGKNVWSKQERRWSESALAMDNSGRILFIFSAAPMTMWDLNYLLLSLPLGIVNAMHLEGGPQASLSIHAGSVNLDLSGSDENGLLDNNGAAPQWPIPNVLGVIKSN
jgi:hypothetical protein